MQLRVRKYFYFCLTFSTIILLNIVTRTNVAWATDLEFAHEVGLHPMSQMPSTITLVPRGDLGGQVDQIRALLVLDGSLLAIKLHPQVISVGARDEASISSDKRPTEYRGSFPTPAEKLSYQFQIILKGGRSQLTERFEVSPSCPGYQILDDMDRETKIMLMAQQQNKRLVIARDLLKMEIKKLENK